MASKNRINNIYSEYKEGLGAAIEKDAFCQYFIRCLQSGRNNMGVTQKKVERKVEGKWLDMIEATVIPLDNIIRKPNRFIKNIEDIVPIEVARDITEESIMHLAQHTNMIAKVEKGMVTPDRILNVTKEESFETYENRFIYTLLGNLDYFIMRCLNSIDNGGKDITEVTLTGESMIGQEKIKYHMYMSCEGHSHVTASDHYELLHADVSNLTIIQRVERIRKILYNFRDTWLIKELKNCELIRPPLHMTNILLRNPDFVKAVELWNFISTYRGEDVEISSTEEVTTPSSDLVYDIFSLIPIQYSIIKNQLNKEMPTVSKAVTKPIDKEKLRVLPLQEQIEVIVDNIDIDTKEIRKIFNNILNNKEEKKRAEKTKIDIIVSNILSLEKSWVEEEKLRLKRKSEA